MRKLLIAALAALPLMTTAAAPQTVILDVQNMTCQLCPITVKKSLEKVPGVKTVKIDFAEKTASVTFDPDQAGPHAFVDASTNAGYPAAVRK
ncbi:MAG: heavy-metal-associated domain-containing protein [Noviherbaspirillum sp.]